MNFNILLISVDGRHPTPHLKSIKPIKTLEILGYLPYQLVQDSSIKSMTHTFTIDTLRKLPIGSMGLLYLHSNLPSKFNHSCIYIYLGSTPSSSHHEDYCIITFLVGNPYINLYWPTVTGWGLDPKYTILIDFSMGLSHEFLHHIFVKVQRPTPTLRRSESLRDWRDFRAKLVQGGPSDVRGSSWMVGPQNSPCPIKTERFAVEGWIWWKNSLKRKTLSFSDPG